MSKESNVYEINGDTIVEVAEEVQAITHRSGMQLGPDEDGNMIINHQSGLIIKILVNGNREIYNSSNKLLNSFKVGEDFSISKDGVITGK